MNPQIIGRVPLPELYVTTLYLRTTRNSCTYSRARSVMFF